MIITTVLRTWTRTCMTGWSRVYAIHLSDDTIDGYGCQVMATISRLYYAERGPRWNDSTEVIYKTTTGDFESDIAACIQKAQLNGYRPGKDLLYFLVTSIADFDPRVFSVTCRGHNYHWIIVDHRKDVNGYRRFDKKAFDDSGNTLKEACSHNRVYITDRDKISTTMILYNAMIRDDAERQWGHEILQRSAFFAKRISDITNRNFGSWSNPVSRIFTPEPLRTKLAYDWFVSRGIPRLWIMEVLASMFIYADKAVVGAACGWLISDLYVDQIQEQVNAFMRGFDVFRNSISSADLPDTIRGLDNLVVYQMQPVSKDMGYQNVTDIYAKEWLRTHPEADVLVIPELIGDARLKYTLYSPDGGVDCAEITKLNHGHGHSIVVDFT